MLTNVECVRNLSLPQQYLNFRYAHCFLYKIKDLITSILFIWRVDEWLKCQELADLFSD
jgi:hypothetical protein